MLQCNYTKNDDASFFILKTDFFERNWVLLYMNENAERSAESLLVLHIHFPLSFPDTSIETGGHFVCACVHPLNDNSVGASNWWREIEHTRKVTVLLKAISLVLWIWFFPTKNVLCDKKRTFSTRVFSCRFFSNRFSWPFKDLKRLNAKNHCSCIRSEFHWQSNAF